MGFFSNTCNALVDKTTGRALSGQALLEAQKDPGWPVCGNKVSRRARFCNKCGKPAPGGWHRCPQCRKWVPNDSRFCPKCNAPMYPGERVDVSGGVWQRESGVFAQRFEAGDVKKLLETGLKVQEGTLAVLLDAGAVCDILQPGRHEPEGFLRKLRWFGNPPPRSFVLVDSGEIAVPLSLESLRTSEHVPVDFYGEIILRFKGGKEDAQAFLSNMLKGGRECSFADIAGRAAPLVRSAVDEMCVTSTLEDLVKDPERRIRLAERLEKRLSEDFAACGLEVVRVSSAEFSGEEYEKLEALLGQAEVARREAEYHAAMENALRKISDRSRMDSAKAGFDMREYSEMLENEYRIASATREREFDLLKREWARDDAVRARLEELEALRHSLALEDERATREIETKSKVDSYEREKKVEDARAGAKEADIWLDVRAKKEELKQKDKAADASRRKGMSLAEMLLDTDDPDARASLIEAMRLQRNASMTPEQLLAELGKEASNDKLVAKLEELYRQAAEREDRNLAKMLEPAIEAARHPSQSTGPIIK